MQIQDSLNTEVHRLQSFLDEMIFLTKSNASLFSEEKNQRLMEVALKCAYASLARARLEKKLSDVEIEELVSVAMLNMSIGYFLGSESYLENIKND